MMVGLAKNVAVPSPHIAAAFADGKLATHDFSVTPKE
jgi:hypothetical protein